MLGALSSSRLTARKALFSVSASRFASSLILAEHSNKEISNNTLAAITAAKAIGGPVHLLFAGKNIAEVSKSATTIEGVSKVFVADADTVDHGLAENLTSLLLDMTQKGKYTHLLASSTNYGRNVVPRVAVKLDVAPISDVTKIINESTFERPMYAGNVIATVESKDPVKVLTIRTTAFDKAKTGSSAATEVETVNLAADTGKAKFVSEEQSKSERPELTRAPIVVSGGRALGKAENFKLVYDLADKLGAAVGASRAAVDAGMAPNELQVGQTGKVVAPNLYIAVGISGAIQHLAGMKDSKVIVAINKDPDAPIFQVADYGIVDDLFKAVPELTSKVPKK